MIDFILGLGCGLILSVLIEAFIYSNEHEG